MVIDLAQEKGLKESLLNQVTEKITDKDSVADRLKDWDQNEDGFVDKTEVREINIIIFMKQRECWLVESYLLISDC